MTAYNVGYQLQYFFSIPAVALGVAGAGVLSRSLAFGNTDEFAINRRTLFYCVLWACVFPPLLAVLTINLWLPLFFGQEVAAHASVIGAQLVALLPSGFAVLGATVLRAYEQPRLIAGSEIVASYLLGLVLYLFLQSILGWPVTAALLLAVLVPSFARLVFLSFATRRLGRGFLRGGG